MDLNRCEYEREYQCECEYEREYKYECEYEREYICCVPAVLSMQTRSS